MLAAFDIILSLILNISIIVALPHVVDYIYGWIRPTRVEVLDKTEHNELIEAYNNHFVCPRVAQNELLGKIHDILRCRHVRLLEITSDMLISPDASIPYINKMGIELSFLKSAYKVDGTKNVMCNIEIKLGDKVFAYTHNKVVHLAPIKNYDSIAQLHDVVFSVFECPYRPVDEPEIISAA